MILYSKFSDERDRKFAICTQIVESEGVKSVRKKALYPEGSDHIRSMSDNFGKLTRQYQHSKFIPNRCALREEYAEFEYLNGQNYQDILIKEAKKNKEDFLGSIREFLSELDRTADTVFTETEEFKAVFGSGKNLNDLPASICTNLDILPDNIIITGEDWNVIDYEWTFSFPIPIVYLKWRVLHYFGARANCEEGLRESGLYETFGITEEMEQLFPKLEQNFQNYIVGKTVPIRELYEDMTPGVDVLNKNTGSLYPQRHIAAVLSLTQGDREVRYTQKPDQNGDVKFEVSADHLKAVRVFPANCQCVVTIQAISLDGIEILQSAVTGNFLPYNENHYLYLGEDAFFNVNISQEKDAGNFILQMHVELLAENTAAALYREIQPYREKTEKQIIRLMDQITALKEQLSYMNRKVERLNKRDEGRMRRIDAYEATLDDLKERKAIKTYRSYLEKRKFPDPFVAVPVDVALNDGIYAHIDTVKKEEDSCCISGWMFDPDYPIERIELKTEDAQTIPMKLERTDRTDVMNAYALDDNFSTCGFRMTYQYSGKTVLEIESKRGILHLEIPEP